MVRAGLLVAVALLSGCAFMNRDNTPLLNVVEDKLWPDQTGWRVLAFPVVFPAGLVAVTLDAVVVHPASVVDDAWGDTKDVLWDDMNWGREYLTVCASLPWRAVCTPVIVTGDFLGRAMFDIERRAKDQRAGLSPEERLRQEEEEAKRQREKEGATSQALNQELDQVETLMEAGKPEEAFHRLTDLRPATASPEDRGRFCLFLLKAGHASDHLQRVVPIWNLTDAEPASLTRWGPEIKSALASMCEDDNPVVRWRAYQIELVFRAKAFGRREVFARALNDRDAVVRQRMLIWIENREWDPEVSALAREAVEKAASDDPDPTNRAFARETLRALAK